MESFFKEALKTINTSGTIAPSSKYLIRSCIKDIDFSEASVILEFGAGNGCITEELSLKIKKSTQLFAFEIHPKFYAYCHNKFKEQDNIHILNESALDFAKILTDSSIGKVDYIISSLPLTLFEHKEIKPFLSMIYKYLKSGGNLVQYQYSLGKYGLLKQYFDVVKLEITVRNIPPAFVYKCHKS